MHKRRIRYPEQFPLKSDPGFFHHVKISVSLFNDHTTFVFLAGFFVYKLIKAEKDKEKARELKREEREKRRSKKKKS